MPCGIADQKRDNAPRPEPHPLAAQSSRRYAGGKLGERNDARACSDRRPVRLLYCSKQNRVDDRRLYLGAAALLGAGGALQVRRTRRSVSAVKALLAGGADVNLKTPVVNREELQRMVERVLATPRAIVERLNREMVAILRSPAQMERFAQQGLESMPSTPEEMTERIRNEYPAWTKVMRAAVRG